MKFILTFFTFTLSFLHGSDALTLKIDSSDLPRDQKIPQHSYSTVLKDPTSAVVSVTTQQYVPLRYSGSSNPLENFLRRYYGLPELDQPVMEKVPSGIGSGVVVTAEGHIITNAHVITDQRTGNLVEEVLVQLADKKEFKAEIVGFDRSTDVAVLKVDADEPLPFVTLADSDLLQVGDIVFAAGNPLGIGLTVTMGIVSATRRTELDVFRGQRGAYENFIQTDASINQGNSGGALLDTKGRLVGINTAIISQTGASIGIGLAIPVNMVRKVLIDFVQAGSIRRGFLGVELLETKDMDGALVGKVVPQSAADIAGFQAGDIIIKVGKVSVYSVNQSRLAISQTEPGTTVPIIIKRDDREISLKVTLDLLGNSSKLLIPGITLKSLTSSVKEEFGIPNAVRGLVVSRSTGEEKTFKKGVVIVEINGAQVSSIDEVNQKLKQGINRFYVWYRGKYYFHAYRIP
ncbi:MAG: trypsin-like peptidase domain-containing protein [Verrucomicrobiota bacterium]|nr:trypsin-like peptidase domain-containing protein [Verrucomicrobiota bacterium]